MSRIDSPSNPRIVAAARALSTGERMPLEGPRMLGEALAAGVLPETVFHLTRKADAEVLTRAAALGAAVVEVSPRVLKKLSDLPSSRGVVALASLPARSARDISLVRIALLLDGVQDPANVGAIVRSAEAFGAEAILLTAGSASPFSARALRASAGSAFRLPIVTGLAPAAAVTWASERGATLVGADAHGGEPPERALCGPVMLAIGSEGHGFSPEVAAALGRRLTIPLAGHVESLNAAVAAAVLLYALSSPKISATKR